MAIGIGRHRMGSREKVDEGREGIEDCEIKAEEQKPASYSFQSLVRCFRVRSFPFHMAGLLLPHNVQRP